MIPLRISARYALFSGFSAFFMATSAVAQDTSWTGRWGSPHCGAGAIAIELSTSTLDLSTFETTCRVRSVRQRGATFDINANCQGEDGSFPVTMSVRVDRDTLSFVKQRGFEFDPKRFTRCAARTESAPTTPMPLNEASSPRQDRLPLQVGYYVETGTPCGSASNGTLSLVRKHAISVARDVCQIEKVEKAGPSSYRATVRCESGETRLELYDIPNDRSYTVRRNNLPSYGARYCNQASLPQPWRSINIRSLVQ